MELVTKALALVEAGEATDEAPNGTFDVILSAPTLDRDNEVIDSRAFDPLPEHIPFDVDHGMTVATTVGSGTPYYAEDGTLRVKGSFASTALAQEVRTLVSEGHIRTTSVTFMAARRQQDEKGVQHVQTAELLNGTFTPIPSNRQAVVLSAKAASASLKAGARNSSTDAERLQSIHDMAVANGAACAAKSHAKSHPGVNAEVEHPEDTTDEPTEDETAEPTDDAATPEVTAESADEAAEQSKALAHAVENAARFAFDR